MSEKYRLQQCTQSNIQKQNNLCWHALDLRLDRNTNGTQFF